MSADMLTRTFEGHGVRMMVDDQGNTWFVGSDVCRALGLANPRDALGRLDDDEKGVGNADTPGGVQRITTISESGLYSLILRSRVDGAKRFKRWVTHEVLPEIRRTGSFGGGTADVVATLNDPAALRGLLLDYTERLLTAEATIAEQAPRVDFADRVLATGDTYGFREAVKVLKPSTGATEAEVRTILFSNGIVQRLGGKPLPTYTGEQRGYVTSRLRDWVDDTGVTHSKPELRITPKGVEWLLRKLREAA